MSRRALAALILAVAMALTACGDGDAGGDAAEPAATTTPVAPTEDSPAPPDLSGQDVCDALPGDDVGRAIGTEVTEAESPSVGTPQCSYSFDEDDTVSSVVVAAQRSDDDLGGRSGQDALDYSVELNRMIAGPDTMFEEVTLDGADAAVAIEGEAVSGVLVLVGGRVITVFSTALDLEQLTGLAASAATALAP